MPRDKVFCNLTVVRSKDMERSAQFYRMLGLELAKHSHGTGPTHYSFEENGHTFEIYPQRDAIPQTIATRIGFSVASVDDTVERMRKAGAILELPPSDSEWGRRAVLRDPDGHTVELVSIHQTGRA